MKRLRSIEEIDNLYGMRVIVRASLDVTFESTPDGKVPYRVHRAIPTIMHLIDKGARVILLTHMGRDPKNSTDVLLPHLQKYLPIKQTDALVGEEALGAVMHMKEGTACLLGNLRSHPGEEKNDPEFAKELASYGDFYVNDAFAVSHREHASIVGIPKYLPSFMGILFEEEERELKKMFTPKSPSLFILGGAKFETKEPLIDEYSNNYTNVFVGGALANDFLKAKGYPVGDSLLSHVSLKGNPLLDRENILLPIDVVVLGSDGKRELLIEHVGPNDKILDVGPRTMEMLAPYIERAETILWNGPLGNYEAGFDDATRLCAELIAKSEAFSIVGGGDTVTAVESGKYEESFGFVSTAGGAMLHYLEHKTLPGITALLR
jgi:phosphoglycerate kinase